MYLAILVLACVAAGYVIGRMSEGININITHKQEEKPEKKPEYNESLVGLLPAEVQQYYNETNGQNRF